MDAGTIVALVFGALTMLVSIVMGAIYAGKLIAAIDRANETNHDLKGAIDALKSVVERHDERLDHLERVTARGDE